MQDVGHRQLGGLGGGEQERGEVARAGGAPERVVGGARGAVVADAEQRRGGAPRAGPGRRRAQRRPHRVPERGGLGGVEHAGLAELRAGGERVVEDVGLDRRREHGSVPLAHRGHDEPGGLARLGRSDDHHRRALLGRDQRAAVMPERDPPRLGAADAQVGEIGRWSPISPTACAAPRRARRLASRQASTTAAATVISEITSTACSSPAPGSSRRSRGRPRERRVGQVREEPGEERARLLTVRSRSGLPCPSSPASALARIANDSTAASAAHRATQRPDVVVAVCGSCAVRSVRGGRVVCPSPGRCRSGPTRGLRGGGGPRTSGRRRATARRPARASRSARRSVWDRPRASVVSGISWACWR